MGKDAINGVRKNTRITLSALALLSLAVLPNTAQAQGPTATYVPGQVIVGYKPTAILPAGSSHIVSVGTLSGAYTPWRSAVVQLDPGVSVSQAIATLQQNSDVAYAEPNYLYIPCSPPVPNDSLFSTQYGPQQVRADAAWGGWQPQGSVMIAVVDSGVDSTHIDLTGKMLPGYNGSDLSTNSSDVSGHGTFVTGIAGASINNNREGIAGIAGWSGFASVIDSSSFVQIRPIRAVNSNGDYRGNYIAEGIRWAVDNRGLTNLVINFSFSLPVKTTDLANAVAYAWNNGCVVVASAGNAPTSDYNYPAAFPNVISVASTRSDNTLDAMSTYGNWVLTAAPGPGTFSLKAGGGYIPGDPDGSGATSNASPHVAGEAALLWAQNPYLTNQDIYNLITQKTDPYTPNGTHTIAATGGRINVYKALLGALGKVIATPDLDGDGKGDLIWYSPASGMVSYWTLDPTLSTGIKAKGQLLATQDRALKFAGYGKLSGTNVLFWQNYSTQAVTVWILNGAAIGSSGLFNNPVPGSRVVAVADLNGDGYADLVLQNPATGNVSYALAVVTTSNGSTSISWSKTGTIFNFNNSSNPWSVVGVMRLDTVLPSTLVLQNSSTGSVYYWMLKNDGSGGVVLDYNNTLYNLNDPNWKVVATPVTGNGTPELLFKNISTGNVYYWLINKGGGSAQNPPSVGQNGTLVPLTDVNWNIVGTPNLKAGQPGVLLQNASTGGVYYWNLDNTGTSVGLNDYVLASP